MSAYITTSTLNNITKWKGPGDDAYDAAAATLTPEVRASRGHGRVRFAFTAARVALL